MPSRALHSFAIAQRPRHRSPPSSRPATTSTATGQGSSGTVGFLDWSQLESEDLKLARVTASDYRDVVYHTTYVDCEGTPPAADSGPTDPKASANDDIMVESGCTTGRSPAPLFGIGLAIAALVLVRRRR